MTRRDILREEVKRLKEVFKIEINVGKLDSIKECRDAIDKIYETLYKTQQTKDKANTLLELYIVKKIKKLEEENKHLKKRCDILLDKILNEKSNKRGIFSFFK